MSTRQPTDGWHSTADLSGREEPSGHPLSRSIQWGAGACLLLAGLLNGGAQYLGHLVIGDRSFSEQIRWGVDNPGLHGAEQMALLVSMMFLPLGVLALAHLARQRSPRLTAMAVLLALWGMWGFHNVVALGYTSGTIAPTVIGVSDAVLLNERLGDHPGAVAAALIPHLLGSSLGFLLLAIACLRVKHLPKVPLVLLIVFVLWDFLLPPIGPLEAHLLLVLAFGWLGLFVGLMPTRLWREGTY